MAAMNVWILGGFLLGCMTQVFASNATTEITWTGCSRPMVPHSEISESNDYYADGETLVLHCSEGYHIQYIKWPTVRLICSDGEWHGVYGEVQSLVCERIGVCPPPLIAHGAVPVHPDGYMPGSEAVVVCDRGFRNPLSEQGVVICQNNGVWRSFTNPSTTNLCISEVSCPAPETIQHGKFHIVGSHSQLIYSTGTYTNGSSVTYICQQGYKIDDLSRASPFCVHGRWSPAPPRCVKETGTGCPYPISVPHTSFEIHTQSGILAPDKVIPSESWLLYTCDKGYVMEGIYQTLPVCLNNIWVGDFPKCAPKMCSQPPDIRNGNFTTIGQVQDADVGMRFNRVFTEGIKVYYYCDNGYKIKDINKSMLECKAAKWQGLVPSCERRTHCDLPMDIQNGNWVVEHFVLKYGIGTLITYECHDGFKPLGSMDLECLSSGYWSNYVPRCLAKSEYCSDPGPVANGVYMCQPKHCDLFNVGTTVHYDCNKGYEPSPDDALRQECLPKGVWSGEKPVCQKVEIATPSRRFTTNTLTVVIATSCGVLGLLVIIMVIVALQRRRKQNPHGNRLCHPSPPPPPPYHQTPPTGLVDDPDRVALIAFADGVQVVLPSYDEAVRSRGGSRLSRYTSDSTRGSIRSSSSRDYRPLPSLPTTLRNGGPQIREIPPEGHRDHHRNSIITTASITTRDNLSLALGSIDTMNISDGTSTSVTVDTASSNPSIATSQRAAAGSLESSSTNGSIAMEDAPLLDQNHYNTETLRSYHSNTSDSHQRCPCTERIGGYDTMHSQCSRSQSESSPIVEIPEDNKDA